MAEDEKRLKSLRELSDIFSELLANNDQTTKTSEASRHKPKETTKPQTKNNKIQKAKDKKAGKGNRKTLTLAKKRSPHVTIALTASNPKRAEDRPPPKVDVRPVSQIKIDRADLETIDIRSTLRNASDLRDVHQEDLAEISSRLISPVHQLTAKREDGVLTDLVLGLDIGSTSSKIVIRLPYSGTAAAQPVPAPSCLQADGHPYYWKTLLWEASEGRFSLLPAAGSEAISTLKVDLLSAYTSKDDQHRAELRMTAYAALMMRQAFGWYIRTFPKLAQNGNFYISINVGFPAASLERDGVQERFRRCCQAAGELALSDHEITAETISSILLSLDQRQADEDPLVEVFPELSGAIAGFIHSSTSRSGTYVLVDVGGLTLDCIFFSLRKDGDNPHYAVYAADICRHGAQVVDLWISKGNSSDRAVAALGNFYALTVKEAHKKLGRRISFQGGSVIPTIPTLMTGGGRKSVVHRRAPSWAAQRLKNSSYAVKLSPEDLTPSSSDMDAPLLKDRSIGRLLVAAGLSLPRADIPTWIKSSDIPDAEPLVVKDYSGRFVGAEQT